MDISIAHVDESGNGAGVQPVSQAMIQVMTLRKHLQTGITSSRIKKYRIRGKYSECPDANCPVPPAHR